MSVIDKLASSLNQRSDEVNKILAEEIANNNDSQAVQELVINLTNKKKDIQSDCIKTLYEIGELKPALISDYINELAALLSSKNNRMQWGAMTALDFITIERPEAIYNILGDIMAAVNTGSVITRDHAVNILIRLCAIPKYADETFPLLIEQLLSCPPNQLPAYAENTLPVINGNNKATFLNTITSRLEDMEKESKRKRVEKVIRKANSL